MKQQNGNNNHDDKIYGENHDTFTYGNDQFLITCDLQGNWKEEKDEVCYISRRDGEG